MAKLSPMMEQYTEIKEKNKDSILFFRLGDFYEMFFDDAKTASRELDLTLTGKDCGMDERAPMCGVPFHSCEGYISRLVDLGYKVAICEQTEDPAKAKGLVKREVVRVITPGTVIEDSMLDESRNNYLCAINFAKEFAGICFADASTGVSFATEISYDNEKQRILNEISRFNPSEVLICESKAEKADIIPILKENFGAAITVRADSVFEESISENLICKTFNAVSVENLKMPKNSAAIGALGAVIDYLIENSRSEKINLSSFEYYTEAQFMRLDLTAVRNLELCETLRSKAKKGSLLWVLDRTKTAMGKRLIRSWLLNPLLNVAEISFRQNAVEELFENSFMRYEAAEYLSGIRDIERITTKILYGTANARDLLNISATVHKFPYIKQLLTASNCKMLREICQNIDTLDETAALIDSAINPEAPITLREGKLIKEGFSEELDTVRRDMTSGTSYLSEIEARERERTGIKNLRVRYNKVFGYYIEVTNSFLDKVPEDYIRKQTLTGAERFITDELKALEVRVLSAKDRDFALEYEIFENIRKTVAETADSLRKTAEQIAKLDVLCSLSSVAAEQNYTRPLVDNSGIINIKDGRHPVVEKLISVPFVANDALLDLNENRCAIITGPNMAGKSTYMRQVALITIMAQIGSFVPASMAQIGVCDAVFTRVGASDDLASGKSTFMVEMSEVADILKNATKNSLLILDEIGRGTSTFDGMSIARAVLEYAVNKKKIGAKSLFATHYHELTQMENELEGVKNYNIAVKKRGDDIIFLRRIVRGGADDSYGIEVAKLGGIPDAVIKRAKEILKVTEEEGLVTYKVTSSESTQLPLELKGATDILNELKAIDVNTLTPIESMSLLFDIVNKAKSV